MHAVINRELEILRSAGSDGDSAWRRTGNLPCRADSRSDASCCCGRRLPRKTIHLRQFPALSVLEVSHCTVAHLTLGAAGGSSRLWTNGNTREIAVTGTATHQECYCQGDKERLLHKCLYEVRCGKVPCLALLFLVRSDTETLVLSLQIAYPPAESVRQIYAALSKKNPLTERGRLFRDKYGLDGSWHWLIGLGEIRA